MIPGANILNMAFNLIGQQSISWLVATGRTQNALGNWIVTYAEPVIVKGSWQPIDAAKYAMLGLDMAKKYFTLYASASVLPVERGTSGDLIEYNGRRYQVDDETDWFGVDGWRQVRCVDIGAAV